MPSYATGQPFGDPSRFTRSTGEDEIARYNDWMRSQPWWQQIRGSGTGDVSPQQEQQIARAAQAQGITVPKDFHIDAGGNFNQKSRAKKIALYSALAGAAALTGGAALGAFGGAGAAGAGGAAAAGSAGTGAGLAGIEGAAFGLPAASAAMIPGAIAAPAIGATSGGAGILGTLSKFASKGKALTDVGNTLSQGAGSLAEGRRADSTADMYAAGSNNRARLDAADFNMTAPVSRAQQVAKGDLMSANIPQSTSSGSGRDISFSGGIGPQSFGPDTTAAGNELKKQALLALMTKSDHLDPQITQPRRAGAGENLMAGAGLATNLLGTLGKFRGR